MQLRVNGRTQLMKTVALIWGVGLCDRRQECEELDEERYLYSKKEWLFRTNQPCHDSVLHFECRAIPASVSQSVSMLLLLS